MAMYSIYNLETLKESIEIVHKMHNATTWNEKLFAGKFDSWYNYYLCNNRTGHCVTNSLLYLRTSRKKYM